LAITDLPLFTMLRTRMQWHQARQRVLAENVANADTPGFRPHDLSPLRFERAQPMALAVALNRTEPGHIASDGGLTQSGQSDGFEVRPDGDTVSLEDQMIKVAANQMDYQAATTLYTRSLNLIKTAIGKS
jgi:flagellar basal-body rod protein FlgB